MKDKTNVRINVLIPRALLKRVRASELKARRKQSAQICVLLELGLEKEEGD